MLKLISVSLAYLCLFTSVAFSAGEAPQAFTFDGRLYGDSTGTSALIDSNISIKVQILDSAESCILYEETQTGVSTISSNGYFTIQVGSAVGATKRSSGDSANSMSQVYSNAGGSILGKTVASGAACTYAPTSGDQRFVRMTVTPSGTGVASVLSPNMPLDSVPNAIVAERAESLQGYGHSQLLKVNTTGSNSLSQSNLENIFSVSNYPILTSLLAGTSSLYSKSAANGTAVLPALSSPTSPAAGQIWYDSGTIKYYNGASAVSLGAGSAGTVTAVATGSGLTGGTITGSGTISLANIANNSILANVSGSAAAPSAVTLSAMIDSAATTAQGSILYRNGASWVALAPGTNGQFLKTQGVAADPVWAAAGSASVSSLDAADGSPTQAVYVDNAGFVGIGTTAPQRQLHLAATNSGTPTMLALDNNDPSNTNGVNLSFRGTTTNAGATSFKEFAAMLVRYETHDNASMASSIRFHTASGGSIGERMRISNTGNVGIGVTGPSYAMDVAGDVNVTGTFRINGTPLSAGGSGTVTNVALFAPSIFSVSGSPITGSGTLSLGLASQTQNLIFASPDGSAGAPVFRALASGDLPVILPSKGGTGVASLTAERIPIVNTGATAFTFDACTVGQILRWNGTSWACVADSTGTVTSVATGSGLTGGTITGSGTISLANIANNSILANVSGSAAAPSAVTLSAMIDSAVSTVQGSILYRNGASWVALAPGTSGQYLQTQGAAANPQWAAASGGGGGASNYLDAADGSPTNALFVDNSGYVGIGTTSPGSTLDVSGAVRATGSAVPSSGVGVQLSYWAGAGYVGAQDWGANVTVPMMVYGQSISLSTGTVGVFDRIHIDVAGNIGFGTGSPTYPLSIAGEAAKTIAMERNGTVDTAGNSLTLQAGGATLAATNKAGGDLILSGGISTGSSGSNIYFQTAASGLPSGTTTRTPAAVMAVTSGGNVGVGTTAPAAKLDVSGGQIRVAAYSAGTSVAIDWNNGNNQYTAPAGAACTAITLSNILDGGSYTLAVQGVTSGTCTFSGGGYTYVYSPANVPVSSDAVYTFLRMGSKVYVSWVSGFQ